MSQLFAVNEKGNRIGEDHQCAVLTDHEVELMRQLYEADPKRSLTALARKFEVQKRTVWKIVTYRSRNQTADRYVPATKGRRVVH